jgi:hypothetical protein
MKYVVYLLLLANLGLFAWLYTHQDGYQPVEIGGAAFPPSIEPLVLLRERGAAAPALPHAGPESAPEPEPEPEPESITDASPVSDAVSPPADSEPATEPESPPEDDAAQVDAQPFADPTPVPVPRVCQTIGPFLEREQVDEFVTRLSQLAQTPMMRTAQVEQPSGYWVYLSAMPRAEANRTIDDLAAKGVKDYFLGRQNVISLGIFSDKRTAENRVRDISALGYQPRLEPRYVTREVYWVDFEERGPEYISAEQWRTLLNAQPDLRRQSLACE